MKIYETQQSAAPINGIIRNKSYSNGILIEYQINKNEINHIQIKFHFIFLMF